MSDTLACASLQIATAALAVAFVLRRTKLARLTAPKNGRSGDAPTLATIERSLLQGWSGTRPRR
jgi:hypothetical protein